MPISWLAWRILGPRPRILISPETTWITEPVTDDGYVDYSTYILQQYGESSVPPNETAMGKLIEAELAEPQNNPVLKYVEFNTAYLCAHSKTPAELRFDAPIWTQPASRRQLRLTRPFSSFDDPFAASVIAQNRNWYEKLRGATDQPVTIALPNDQVTNVRGNLFDSDCDVYFGHRLQLRVMLNLGERRFGDAWNDIELMQRLAAREFAAPVAVGSELNASLAETTASECAAIGILHAENEIPELKEWLVTFPIERPVEQLRRRVETDFRISYLRSTQFSHSQLRPAWTTWGESDWFIRDRWHDANKDWDEMLRLMNRFINRVSMVVCPKATFHQQRCALREVADEIAFEWKKAGGSDHGISTSALHVFFKTANQLTASYRFTHIAWYLAAWEAKHGAYPTELKDVIPQTESDSRIERIFTDPFSGERFRYERRGNGFILYSVGENIEDDFGIEHSAFLPRGYKSDGNCDIRTGRTPDDIVFKWQPVN